MLRQENFLLRFQSLNYLGMNYLGMNYLGMIISLEVFEERILSCIIRGNAIR